MSEPRSDYVLCEDREIHFMEWGAGQRETVVMWHGLGRTGRDFDDLARHLSGRYRVLCPDMIGRGLSQWSPRPEVEYCYDFYSRIAVSFIDQLAAEPFHWVGTSMGAGIGLRTIPRLPKGRVRKFVMNDFGPRIAEAAVTRIRSYAGNPPAFARASELETYLRTVYKPYGFLTDAQWRRLAETSARRLEDGRITTHYDPRMVYQFIHHPNDQEHWPQFEALTLPVLCLRGAESDLLLRDTAEQMKLRGPRARVVEIAGCGHAPALNVPDQFALIDAFLAA